MRRFLVLVLIAVLGSTAAAQDLRFGVRLGLDVTNAVGFQLRWDDNRAADGFGVRVLIGSSVILSAAEATGFYRFATDVRGSNGYVGAGGGVLAFVNAFLGLTGGDLVVFAPFVAGVLGFEFVVSDHFTLFAELRGNLLFSGTAYSVYPTFGLGLNLYL